MIYIPLWFYSNCLSRKVMAALTTFTFHYGSILIFSLSDVLNRGTIYIPLWFYSNETYSLSTELDFVFTFHYGSILIKNVVY